MSNDPMHLSPVFRIDVSAEAGSQTPPQQDGNVMVALLREMVAGQARTNQLLRELVDSTNAAQRQRSNELRQWKEANPQLAKSCRLAAETLSRVQTQFLEAMTEEIVDNEECLIDGEFMLNEFVDRFGPRMAHLNGVLQVLAQLGSGVAANQPQ